MSETLTTRISFVEGQILHGSDLDDERHWRDAGRQRHDVGLHRGGVLSGLGLGLDAAGSRLVVGTGSGTDGAGRGLIVERRLALPFEQLAARFAGWDTDCLDLWLVVCSRVTSGVTPGVGPRPGVDPCAVPGGPVPRLVLERVGRVPITSTRSTTDGIVAGPLHLARIFWDEDGGTDSLVVSTAERPRSGLIAAALEDTRNRWRLTAQPAGRNRITLHQSRPTTEAKTAQGNAAKANTIEEERLRVDSEGRATLIGPTRIAAGLELNSKLDQQPGQQTSQRIGRDDLATLAFGSPAAQVGGAEVARPASLYRNIDPSTKAESLRFEFRNPEGDDDPTAFRFAIGQRDAEGFRRCLTVDAECTLRLGGNLAVEGRLVEAPIPADPNDPRFAAAAASAWWQGLGATIDQTGGLTLTGLPDQTLWFEGEGLGFEIDVANSGSTTLSSIEVRGQLATESGSGPSAVLGQAESLAVGGSLPLHHEFDPVVAGSYNLVLSVSARTPGGALVSAAEILAVEVLTVIN